MTGEILVWVYVAGWAVTGLGPPVMAAFGRWSGTDHWQFVVLGALWPLLLVAAPLALVVALIERDEDPCQAHDHQLGPPVPLECVPTGDGGHTTITLMPCARCHTSVEFGDNSRALTPVTRHDFVQGLRERGIEPVLRS